MGDLSRTVGCFALLCFLLLFAVLLLLSSYCAFKRCGFYVDTGLSAIRGCNYSLGAVHLHLMSSTWVHVFFAWLFFCVVLVFYYLTELLYDFYAVY